MYDLSENLANIYFNSIKKDTQEAFLKRAKEEVSETVFKRMMYYISKQEQTRSTLNNVQYK